MTRRGLLAPSLAFALAAGLACGSEGEVSTSAPVPAEQAAASLAEARAEVEALRRQVAGSEAAAEAAESQAQSAEEALEKAREAHDRARNALRDAEQRLASLEPPPPSDEEVFRRVQKQLLDAPALAQVAIKAEVDDRTVTLHGTVPDQDTRDAALAIARSVDGVADVRSQIEVND